MQMLRQREFRALSNWKANLVTARHMTSEGSLRLIFSVRRVPASHSRSVLSAAPDTSRCCCGCWGCSGSSRLAVVPAGAAGTNATAVTLCNRHAHLHTQAHAVGPVSGLMP